MVNEIIAVLTFLAVWCVFWFCVGWVESAHEHGRSALWFLGGHHENDPRHAVQRAPHRPVREPCNALVEPDTCAQLHRIEAELKAIHKLLVAIADAMGLNQPKPGEPYDEPDEPF